MNVEYLGMSYEQASREAERLLRLGWFKSFDRLIELRSIMQRELLLKEIPEHPQV